MRKNVRDFILRVKQKRLHNSPQSSSACPFPARCLRDLLERWRGESTFDVRTLEELFVLLDESVSRFGQYSQKIAFRQRIERRDNR